MKMKQISDSTIKITMKLEDLEEHGMEMSDFLVPQEKTEEFFYTILDELDMPESFMDTGMLSFRVTPKPDRLDVFVTKSNVTKHLNFEDLGEMPDMDELNDLSPDEFIKFLEKNIMEKSHGDQEAIDHLAQIEQLQKELEEEVRAAVGREAKDATPPAPHDRYIYYILKFAQLSDVIRYVKRIDYDLDTSELYKMDHHYYLTILVDLEEQSHAYPEELLARMREHAEDSDVSRSILQEHGHVILVSDAVEELGKISLV